MRRLVLAVMLVMAGCAVDAEAAAAPDETVPDEAPAVLVDGLHIEGNAGVWVVGSVEHAHEPATFTLRTENDCARDVTLRTMTVGASFTVELGAADLTDAFACAIDASVGDTSTTLTLTPDAHASEAPDLLLDPAFAVVAATLDPRDGHMIRFTVEATGAVERARASLDGIAYGATLAPAEEGNDAATAAIFEVPAKAWAAAMVSQSEAQIDVTLHGGATRAMTLRPTARIEPLVEDCH